MLCEITVSQNVRPHIVSAIRLLVCVTIEIVSYSQNPRSFAAEESHWNRGKPGGAKHAKGRMSRYRPVVLHL